MNDEARAAAGRLLEIHTHTTLRRSTDGRAERPFYCALCGEDLHSFDRAIVLMDGHEELFLAHPRCDEECGGTALAAPTAERRDDGGEG